MTTGTTAPRYAFERELGQGGFGSVVLATDSVLGRRVALKSLRGGDSRALAGEARVLAGLRHPNIVQAYDFTTIDGEPYLVLEFVDVYLVPVVCPPPRRGLQCRSHPEISPHQASFGTGNP